ncbi:MAG: hypothetical protein ACOCQM_04360 [Natronomonas sp.]
MRIRALQRVVSVAMLPGMRPGANRRNALLGLMYLFALLLVVSRLL